MEQLEGITSMLVRALILTLLVLFTAVNPIDAKIVARDPIQFAEFHTRKTLAGDVYMDAPLTRRQEWNQYVEGTFFLVCYKGSINDFKFNSVLRTTLVDYIDSSEAIYVGVSKSINKAFLPLASKQTDAVDHVPEELDMDKSTRAFSTSVRSYNPFGTEERESIYLETFVDADFVRSFFDSDRISMALYDKEGGRFDVIYHARYTVGTEERESFLREGAQQ